MTYFENLQKYTEKKTHRGKEIAAGTGIKSALKDISDSLFFWGVSRTYQYGIGVEATYWDGVSKKKKTAINRKITAIAKKIPSREGRIKHSLKTKGMFSIMRMMQKNGWNKKDADYWKAQGWLEKKRPWKL